MFFLASITASFSIFSISASFLYPTHLIRSSWIPINIFGS